MPDHRPIQLPAAELLEFFALAERLKTELRHSWLSNGRQESVAEHTWMMALMAITLAPSLEHPVDLGHVLKLIIVHDLAEVRVGDIPVFEVSERKNAKVKAELAAMVELQGMLPEETGKLIASLWHEYEDGTTAEAQFARAIDHLEVQAQHNLAKLDTWEAIEHDLVYTKMDDRCAHDLALWEMAQALRTQAENKLAEGDVDISVLRARHGLPLPQQDSQNS
ncbi:putative hydrolase of HD superfamily [Rhizobium sp. SJZ105]|uniref:HD domain-containing protein n=1 Tax=Rhizobium sp. SJZ105 TaxID=2572678 RepID=UPI0011A6921C|nr:HD domain-containing protein [Rhizobium sp. SJZ105]TWC76276.1 putative hydrolase of HD superfamily [Rhizobium sp. SJZ105]